MQIQTEVQRQVKQFQEILQGKQSAQEF